MRFTPVLVRTLLGQRQPVHRGRLQVHCQQAVQIRRDAMGVAYVDAKSEHDAWFGLGFCHGQDRSGQLELTLRLLRGTLAAAVGERGLVFDRMSRSIGFRRAAAAQWALLQPEIRHQIQAYVDGINAARESPGAATPLESTLLRMPLSPWESVDVLALGGFMCFALPSNWDVELARLVILLNDGPDAVRALEPVYPRTLPVTSPPGTPAGAAVERLALDLEALQPWLGGGGGSNAWALRRHKTASGRPLLANDPHLAPNIPNVGYLARVACPEFQIAGVSFVGAPAFITGHNGFAAWGTTAAHADNTDLYLEQLSEQGTLVRSGDDFEPCTLLQESIDVKGGAPVEHQVIITPRGPVIATASSPGQSAFGPLTWPESANAISLRATWLAPRPTAGLLAMHRVRSFEQFRAAFSQATASTYSVVYADCNDDIGWLLGTEIPRRVGAWGSLPQAGWHPETAWRDPPYTADELPYAINPSVGFVACANNKPVPDDAADVFLGHDFLDGYRLRRITDQLRESDAWDPATTAALQLDVYSSVWQELRPVVCGLNSRDRRSSTALALLLDWDGRVSADSPAATVFEMFLSDLCRGVARAKAPQAYEYAMGKGLFRLGPNNTFNTRRAGYLSWLVVEQPPGFFASWPEALLASLRSAVRQLERRYGRDPAAWTWGKVRTVTLRHAVSTQPLLAKLFDRGPYAAYGDSNTVNQAGLDFTDPTAPPSVTAHMRSIIDVGKWSASRWVLFGGQSGNPVSPNYSDQVALWQKGEGVPIYWEEQLIASHARNVLQLRPKA